MESVATPASFLPGLTPSLPKPSLLTSLNPVTSLASLNPAPKPSPFAFSSLNPALNSLHTLNYTLNSEVPSDYASILDP
jgi:hypothetical protein